MIHEAIRRFFNGGIVPASIVEQADLRGQVAIVTGALKGGLGWETAKVLYEMGATVILAVIDQQKGEESAREMVARIKQEATEKHTAYDHEATCFGKPNYAGSGLLDVMVVDLSDLESVKLFTENFKSKYSQLDILVNNAGVMLTPHGVTKQGVERQFGINYLGSFLVVHELMDLIISSNGRVINLSSICMEFITKRHTHTFSSFTPESVTGPCMNSSSLDLYNRSKFASAVFTQGLDRFFKESTPENNAFSVCCHPGVIQTNLYRHRTFMLAVFTLFSFMHKTPFHGAQTSMFLSLAPRESIVRGEYYADCKPKLVNNNRYNVDLQHRLWDTSLQLCKDYISVKRMLPSALKKRI